MLPSATYAFIILCAGSALVLVYALYIKQYGHSSTMLAFRLDDPVCFNPEFHHQFLRDQLAKLSGPLPTNQPESLVRYGRVQFGDLVLPLAIPSQNLRIQTSAEAEAVAVSSAHDIVLDSVSSTPYIYGADVAVSNGTSFRTNLVVARQDLRIVAPRIDADGILANGDVDINTRTVRATRISGFSYSINAIATPDFVRNAYRLRRTRGQVLRAIAHSADAAFADGTIVVDDVICGHDLSVGTGCTVHGAVKTYGSLTVTGPAAFLGPVVVNGDLVAPEGCVFLGDVVVKGAMRVGRFFAAGVPSRKSVCVVARTMELEGPVTGSGTLVASEREGLRHAA